MTSANDRIRELQANIDELRRQIDPVRSHKFTVWLFDYNPEAIVTPVKVPAMSISGLATFKDAGAPANHVAAISRAVIPGDRVLADWYNAGNLRGVRIDVPELDQVFLEGCKPTSFSFSDLEANGTGNHFLFERLEFKYRKLTY